MNLPRFQTATPRNRLIVGCVLLILLVGLGSYVLWSKQVWSQYTPSYTAWRTELKTAVDRAIKLPVTTKMERVEATKHFKILAESMSDKQETVCVTNPLVQWQGQFMKSLNEDRMACGVVAANVKEFHKRLLAVVAYSDDDQELAKILSTISQPEGLNEDALPEQSHTWNAAIETVKKMSVSEDFKPTQQRAVEKMTSLKMAWEALNAAHQAKDKTKYMVALAAVGASYDGLDEITTTTEATLANLAKGLQVGYQKAFN
jgi:hypothetical protein